MESSSPTSQPPAKLERIGRYRIIRPLSKGGMALVYEARRESLAGVSPRVAVKVILPEYTDSDTFQELFINEARLGASMHHQNLIQIQDFDRDGDRFFLVMEYVEGITLRRAITLCRRHAVRVPMGVLAEVGRQACDGLHYAHSALDEQGNHLRLVHRDVKPSNLILSPHGVIKLLDFGISKGRIIRERKGAVKGTWGYMSPEQAFGKEVGPRADVFGLATVLYELASLRVLFEGKDKTTIKRLLLDDHAARMAATLDPLAYGPLVSVLVRALQRDPEARFINAAEYGRALSSLLPDPITARDEVVSFYRLVSALNEGVPVEQATKSADFRSDVSQSQGSLAASLHGTHPPSSVPWWIVGAVAGLALVVVMLLVTILVLQSRNLVRPPPEVGEHRVADVLGGESEAPRAAEEPAGPAGEGAPGEERPPPLATRGTAEERPPPVHTVLPPTGESATIGSEAEEGPRVVVVRKKPEPDPEAVTQEPGLITIGARQEAEVYVDGSYVRRVPVVRREFPPGRHVITIQALDGRRKTFEVDLESGEEIRKVWDFDRGEWRK
jgi:serine/threonine-protein kinase